MTNARLDPVTHEDPAYARGWNDALAVAQAPVPEPVSVRDMYFFEAGVADAEARLAQLPAQEGLSWAIEYAIERLTDVDLFPDWQQPGNVIGDLVDVLHGGLTGKPPGLSAVGTRCPVCDAKRGLYDVPPEPHHD